MKESPGVPAIPFKILSLDGGGIRGAFIASFLADLEAKLNCRIGEHFDLIAGTSTGAIIAAAVALGEPAAKIEQFYRTKGPLIFTRRAAAPMGWRERIKSWLLKLPLKRYGLDYDQLKQSKYESTVLRSALTEAFGDRKIGDIKTCRLIVPAVDLTAGQTIVFKTPHLPNMFRDRHYPIVDVLMATTAAPTYFPHAVIAKGSAYVDGGLWANNPAMAAIVEAIKIGEVANREGIDLPISQGSISLLSVGTGRATYFAKPPEAGAGVLWWAPHLLNVSSVSQSQGINFQVMYAIGPRMHRIDYDLPDGTWSLDSTDLLEQMIELGRRQSVENLARLRPAFFESRAQHPYHPFPDASATGT